jgi:acyl-CoA synthetase (AMP-forming)/AMP-acid ligase II
MAPERIHIVAELARTGAGKIDRDRLQWQAEAATTMA